MPICQKMKPITGIFLLLFACNMSGQTWNVINKVNSPIPSDNVTSISSDQDGKIWISTLGGIAGFDTVWHPYNLNNTSTYEEILNVWCKDSTVWVGTEFRGLWSFDGISHWVDYNAYSSGNGINGFGVDGDSIIWILDKFGNFSRWNGNQWIDVLTFIDHPNSLFVDRNGTKWILSGNMGLIRYQNGEVYRFNNSWDENSPAYIPDASLYSMAEDSEGIYWIGSYYKGLLRFDGTSFVYFDTLNSGICSNHIRTLAIDENDILWIGTWDGGVSKFDGSTWTTFNTINSPLSSNIVNSISIARDHKIWMANGYNGNGGGKGIVVLDENNDNSGGMPPNAPSSLKLKGISIMEVVLNWTDHSENEAGFFIERSVNDTSHFQQIKFINQGTTTYTDYSVTSENQYFYRVAAQNAAGVSAFTSTDSIRPKYCATNKASYSCYANVTGIKFGSVQNSVFNSLNGYYDYLDQSAELKPGQTLAMTISFDRYSITSDDIIGGEVYIDWNTDGDFEDENELIFRNLNINGKGTYVIPVHVPDNATEGISRLRTVTDDDTYVSIGPCGYKEETQDYTIVITSKTALAKPSETKASALTSHSIHLSWRDNSFSEGHYLIEKSSDSIHFVKLILTGPNTIEYTDTALIADQTCYYRIAAVSGTDTSGFSDLIFARTLTVDFVLVTAGDLATNPGYTQGVFWGDYNNDRRTDVFTSGQDKLFTNENGVLNNSGLIFQSTGSPAWGDYNNDGYPDLYTTGYDYSAGNTRNLLYKNSGNNTFTEIVPFEAENGPVSNCVWLDINRDGKLDIFLSYPYRNYGKIYTNNGDDTFTEWGKINEASGFSTFADYDNDGDLDLLVAGYYDLLFENKGDSTFEKNQNTIIGTDIEDSNGASWGDIDNDGDLDLFEANGRFEPRDNSLYINMGNGSFKKLTSGDLVHDGGESYGSSFCDFDNDGNLDLVVTNNGQTNSLYRGHGDGTFDRIDQSAIMMEFSDKFYYEMWSMGCAWGDYNLDGFSDLVIANNSDIGSSLFLNSGNSNHWIKIKLSGTLSNRSAIGAKVTLWSGNKLQYREISSQTGFAGQNEMNVSFGLGKKSNADSIIIQWPSGTDQVLNDIAADQFIEVTEPGTTGIRNPEPVIQIRTFPNPVNSWLVVNITGSIALQNIELLDMHGRIIISLNPVQNSTVLNTGDLSKGIYFLRVRNERSVFIEKIIKE